MTITIIIGLGSLTIGEVAIVLVLGIAAGMLLDRLGNMMKKRELEGDSE